MWWEIISHTAHGRGKHAHDFDIAAQIIIDNAVKRMGQRRRNLAHWCGYEYDMRVNGSDMISFFRCWHSHKISPSSGSEWRSANWPPVPRLFIRRFPR